jgi:hypothetical protein
MVIVKGERRYYGRGETGNYVLSEPEVAQLYERREITKASIFPLLEKVISNSPIKAHNGFAHLHIVLKPVLQDEYLLDKASALEQRHKDFLNRILLEANNSNVQFQDYYPKFSFQGWIHCPEGYLSKMAERSESSNENHSLFLQVNSDGSGNLFCSRAAETRNERDIETKSLFSNIDAGNTNQFLDFFRVINEKSFYFGMVDIGIC